VYLGDLLHCHVWGIPWRIIMGSGLYNWIYWYFFSITINYNSSESMAAYDSLDYKCLLFYCVECRKNNPLRMPNDWTLVTERTSRRTEYKSPCLTVPLLFCFIRCLGNVFAGPLPSNRFPLWLHYSGFQASCHIIAFYLQICCVLY
jgi:hypothetical protein